MYFLHAINSDRQTRLLNVLGQIAMILGDKKSIIFTIILNTLIYCEKKLEFLFLCILVHILITCGYAVVQLFEALRYKPEGRGFDFQWCPWISSLT